MTDPTKLAIPGAVYGEDVPYLKDIIPSTRTQGWCGARQRRFLEAIADGSTVREACKLVGLSTASAYAFRRRANGRAFDLGWKGADLLAREKVAADLLDRAFEGQTVEITRADGSIVTRHHFDNRLALQMLNRLDRYADQSENTAPGHAARLVASDFDAYLRIVGEEGGPARAGLYMLARGSGGAGDAAAAELEPVLALARADRFMRCGTADGSVADLDPARRADWTAEQWARAEAAGLVALAPPPPVEADDDDAASTRQPCSTCADPEAPDQLERSLDDPVWWSDQIEEWRTNFPPPADFDGEEDAYYGHIDYERSLTPDEEEVAMRRLGAAYGLSHPPTLEEAEAERDRWFGPADESGGVEEAAATPASPADGPDAAPAPDPSGAESRAVSALDPARDPAGLLVSPDEQLIPDASTCGAAAVSDAGDCPLLHEVGRPS